MATAPHDPQRPQSGPLASAGSPGTGEIDPAALLQMGAKRAKNISHALVMIVVLLVRHFMVTKVRDRLLALKSRSLILLARVLRVILVLVAPHLAKLQARAASTTNQAARSVLLAAIRVLKPVEEVASLSVKVAKLEGAKLTAAGARRTALAIQPMFKAVGQVIQSGFQLAAVQRLLGRLVALVDEASGETAGKAGAATVKKTSANGR